MADAANASKPTALYGPPMKPRKGLAIGLLAAFAVWTAVLWVMYFTSVHRHTHVERIGPEGAMPSSPSRSVPR